MTKVKKQKNRRPIHAGEILLQEFLTPLEVSQTDLAKAIGVSFQKVNEIVQQKRDITADTALRFAKFFGTTPNYWLKMRMANDLYKSRLKLRLEIDAIRPLASPKVSLDLLS